jgi:hypothetical protein
MKKNLKVMGQTLYQRLRDILNSNDLLYMIQEPLGDALGKFKRRMIMVIIVITVTFP